MIYAAGLGTRLRPITNNKPKALVEIGDSTLLEIAIKKLINFGVKRIVINVHHFADQIIQYITQKNFTGAEIVISDERQQLLDTGGGLRNARELFIKDSPIITYNVDILSNINLSELFDYHNNNKNFVSIFVQNRETSRYLLFDKDNHLCGWQNPKTNEEKWSSVPKPATKLGNNCIQVLDYKIFSYLTDTAPFPIIPFLVDLAATEKICGWINNDVTWFDIGTPEKLLKAKEYSELLLIK